MPSRKKSNPKPKRRARARVVKAESAINATIRELSSLTHQQVSVATEQELEQLATHLFNEAAAIVAGLHDIPADATPRLIWSTMPLGRLVETATAYAKHLQIPLDQIVQHAIMHMNPAHQPEDVRWN